jgi:hypothetical protein
MLYYEVKSIREALREAQEMNSPDECEVCRRLAAEYEAATMEWFRVQGQLRIAEYARDENATNRTIAELSGIAARRHALREAKEKHEVDKHPRMRCAGS